VREQRAFLGDVADAPALRRHVQAGAADGRAVDRDRAGVRALEAADQPQERRLAAARGPEDRDEPAALDREIDIRERAVRAEILRKPGDRKVRHRT